MITRTNRPRFVLAGAAAALGLALCASALPPAFAAPTTIADARFDLTGNQVVNGADLDDGARFWADAVAGSPNSAADLNGDGQIDVGDMQLLAGQLGQGTSQAALDALANQGATLQQDVPTRVFTVNSAASGSPINTSFGDANLSDGVCATASGSCTLQAAVQQANAPRDSAFKVEIRFDIRNSDGSCPAVVQILPNLDYQRWLQIDDSSGYGTVIDGYSQCGARPNSGDVEGNADIRIEIIGTKIGTNGAQFSARKGVNGIEIKSANNVIRGIAVYNWDRQIELSAPGALYNRIEGNFIGTDRTNSFISKPRPTHEGEGVRIQFGASYNVLGCGSFASDGSFQPCTDRAQANAARNIVAGNGNDGIHIERTDSGYNRVVGNYIGIAQDGRIRKTTNGTSISKNQADGVDFEDGANNNWLGGTSELERNIVSGNQSEGIEVSHNSRTQFNHVAGNWFGVDAFGDPAGNGDNGVSMEDLANNNYIYNNLISHNGDSGFRTWVLADENQVYDNTITNNKRNGVYLFGGSQHNLIRNNVIANNSDRGVSITTESDKTKGLFGETYYNTISQNSIYGNRREGIKHTNRIDSDPKGNMALKEPEILNANASLAVGIACPGCKVEIFIADKSQLPEPGGENSGEGRTFVGEGVASGGGEFAVELSGVNAGQLITATGTDTLGNTSEFARNVRVNAATVPVPTLTPRPTLTPTAVPTPAPAPTLPPGQVPDRYRVYIPVVKGR
jgi:parallel beta-helix repeat protein